MKARATTSAAAAAASQLEAHTARCRQLHNASRKLVDSYKVAVLSLTKLQLDWTRDSATAAQ